MAGLNIDHLNSGGLITNYYCTSECGHCLYRCSPRLKKDYIDRQSAKAIMQQIQSVGCNSIHIGGGEPLLNPDGLADVADAATETGMFIEYVETNSSWFTGEEKAVQTVSELKKHGIGCLLVSMSPFHNEHIPLFKVKGVLDACRNTGMRVFPWIMEFYREIDSFDDRQTHTNEEYSDKFGKDYFRHIPLRYWIHLGGRAIDTYREIFPLKALTEVLNCGPCRELSETGHFHIDLYGNYVPGLCTGLAVQMEDLGKELAQEKYPVINMLYSKGIKAFVEYATDIGFVPQDRYLNKCHLCNHVRSFLVNEKKVDSAELKPEGYYRAEDQTLHVSE